MGDDASVERDVQVTQGDGQTTGGSSQPTGGAGQTTEGAGQTTGGAGLPELGRRGEGWVVLQGVLIVALVWTGLAGPRWPARGRRWRKGAALPLAAGGAWLLGAGGAGLGRQLTPFPKPVAEGDLRKDGVYALVRHPMYGGVLLTAAAWTLVSSPLTAVPSLLGAAFLEAKRRREEAWLADQHPGYEDYRRQVRRALIPWVW